MKNKNVLYLTQAAMIAALYVVLTMIANALGIASGNIQVRFSEALTVLPFLTPAAVPGLFIGCLIANLVTGAMLPDIIFGSLATLIGAIGTWMLGKAALGKDEKQKKLFTWLSPLPPILANAVIIPPVLKYAYGILPMWFSVITVTAGEIISCGIFGLILLAALKKHKKGIVLRFLEVTIPFFFTCNRMHALRAFYCHEYAINRFPFSSNMLRASFMPFL